MTGATFDTLITQATEIERLLRVITDARLASRDGMEPNPTALRDLRCRVGRLLDGIDNAEKWGGFIVGVASAQLDACAWALCEAYVAPFFRYGSPSSERILYFEAAARGCAENLTQALIAARDGRPGSLSCWCALD